MTAAQHTENWIDTRTWMSSFYYSQYKAGKLPLSFLITATVPKEIFLITYRVFLNYKQFDPIENLPEPEKKKLVEECRATGLKFSNRTLIEAAKILYTIKNISK